jgi:hypothetical protein
MLAEEVERRQENGQRLQDLNVQNDTEVAGQPSEATAGRGVRICLQTVHVDYSGSTRYAGTVNSQSGWVQAPIIRLNNTRIFTIADRSRAIDRFSLLVACLVQHWMLRQGYLSLAVTGTTLFCSRDLIE